MSLPLSIPPFRISYSYNSLLLTPGQLPGDGLRALVLGEELTNEPSVVHLTGIEPVSGVLEAPAQPLDQRCIGGSEFIRAHSRNP